MIARLFSPRIRELERANANLRALLDKDFDKVSVTRMNFDSNKGLEVDFKTSIGGLFVAWAHNALKDCGSKNYIEFSMFHPDDGFLTVTVQKQKGETPAMVVKRLEREIAELRRHNEVPA